jgi:hypothetical protein
MTEFGDSRPCEGRERERLMDELRLRNNPNNEPTGDFTGRCMHCGSKDLWTDNLTYGCNCCKAIFIRS